MKKIILPALAVLLFVATMTDCSKGGGGNGGCNETALQVTTTPANNSVDPAAPGPDFPLLVSITSTIPSAGVTIVVNAHPESSTTNFFSQTKTATAANTSFTITGTPATTSCMVEITITSKSCNTNKWTGSYRYSRK